MTKCGTFPVATTTCSGEDALKRVCSTTANRFRAVCEAKVLGRAHHDRILPQGFQVPPRLNAWLCSSGGRDPLIPSCLASFSVSPRLEGRCGFQGFFDPFGDDCLRSIPGEALPFGTLAFPSGRLDRRPDGLRSLSLRSDWFGADRGRLRPPPRSDLRREARIPGCVVATDGDPAQDGVRRQDVVVSTIRFGCRSGESNGPIRIGTFSCSPRKGGRFAGPPHEGVVGLGSRGVSCPFTPIPRFDRSSRTIASPSAVAVDAARISSASTTRTGTAGIRIRTDSCSLAWTATRSDDRAHRPTRWSVIHHHAGQ